MLIKLLYRLVLRPSSNYLILWLYMLSYFFFHYFWLLFDPPFLLTMKVLGFCFIYFFFKGRSAVAFCLIKCLFKVRPLFIKASTNWASTAWRWESKVLDIISGNIFSNKFFRIRFFSAESLKLRKIYIFFMSVWARYWVLVNSPLTSFNSI